MDIHQRVFFYSHEQHEEKKKIASRMNQQYTPGQVMVNGQLRSFTEMSMRNTSKFDDAKIITEGRIDKIYHIAERFD